jgi:hypothetical protein
MLNYQARCAQVVNPAHFTILCLSAGLPGMRSVRSDAMRNTSRVLAQKMGAYGKL